MYKMKSLEFLISFFKCDSSHFLFFTSLCFFPSCSLLWNYLARSRFH